MSFGFANWVCVSQLNGHLFIWRSCCLKKSHQSRRDDRWETPSLAGSSPSGAGCAPGRPCLHLLVMSSHVTVCRGGGGQQMETETAGVPRGWMERVQNVRVLPSTKDSCLQGSSSHTTQGPAEGRDSGMLWNPGWPPRDLGYLFEARHLQGWGAWLSQASWGRKRRCAQTSCREGLARKTCGLQVNGQRKRPDKH